MHHNVEVSSTMVVSDSYVGVVAGSRHISESLKFQVAMCGRGPISVDLKVERLR